MITIARNPAEPRYIFLTSDVSDEFKAIEEHLNPYIPFTLLPTSKMPPTREVFLDKFRRGDRWIGWCSAGLWKEVVDFCAAKKIPIDASAIDKSFKYTNFKLSKEEFRKLVASWELNIEPRDYQIEAAWLILRYRLSLSELATRAGKTLIFYMVSRAMKEVCGAQHILMIVPSIHLVKQGVTDLAEYKEYFNCEQIWADGEEVSLSDLTIGTFQSLVRRADKRYKNYDPAFFDKFDVVVVDEAHKAPCRSIKTILALEAFKFTKLRFGFTGTLPKPNTIEWMACQAILGPKIQEIRARDLIEEGFLAEPIIEQYRIVYETDKEVSQALTTASIRTAEYLLSSYVKDEKGNPALLEPADRVMTMIHQKKLPEALVIAKERLEPGAYLKHLDKALLESTKTLPREQLLAMLSKPKIELIMNIIAGLHKNVIVFAHNTEYINYLEGICKERFPDRNVYKIYGGTTLKKRLAALDKMLDNDNNILIASFACCGTGLTLRRLDYGIFAQSFKADTITRQSLGRLMLRTPEKPEFYLYDIIDCFPTKRLEAQGRAKVKIYKTEGHQNTVITLKRKYETIL